MKKIILISFLLIYSMSIYAQFDKKNTPIRLELKSKTNDVPDNFSSDLPSIDFKSTLDNKDDNYLKKYEK